MPATNYTPIQLYRTNTASTTAPSGANLNAGELAINYNDSGMILYAKNTSGTVIKLMNNPANLLYPTADGTANQVIKTNGSGVLSFATVSTSPGGSDTYVQFNDSGSFGGDAGLTYNKTTDALTAAGTVTATKLVPTGNVTAGNGMYLPTTNTLAFGTNGTEAMRIDSSGNLGLGVTPSAWQSSSKAYEIGSGGASQGTLAITSSGILDISRNAYIASGGVSTYKYNGYASQYRQDSSGLHVWQVAPSGTAGNAITFTQVLSVDRAKTLALEGASTQTGTGITFPATQSASSNSNTLDDYEEGTFTPTITASGGGTPTYIGQTGIYTKIGRVVSVYLNPVFSKNTLTGNIKINGLPFTIGGGSAITCCMSWYIPSGTSVYDLTAFSGGSNTALDLFKTTAATTDRLSSPFTAADINSDVYLHFNFVYYV